MYLHIYTLLLLLVQLQQAVVLATLQDGGERQWLFGLLQAFNKGSLDEYEEIMKQHEAKIMQTVRGSRAFIFILSFRDPAYVYIFRHQAYRH